MRKKLGRPRELENARSYHLVLPEKLAEYAADIGNGNLSKGVRIAIRKYKDEQHKP